jgi:hypothetical protein
VARPRAPGELDRARVRPRCLFPSAGSLRPARIELDSFHVEIGGGAVRSSTTMGGVGAWVVAVATTLPDQVLGLTSCYLGQLYGAIAASHLRLGPDLRRLSAQVLPRPRTLESTHAHACSTAAELQQAIADLTGKQVAGALARGVEAWARPRDA